MTQKLLYTLLFVTIILVACGGGGGGSSSLTTPIHTTSTPSNSNLQSQNATPVVTNLQNYPTAGGYDYGSNSIVFGKFGGTTANCYLNQNITRSSSQSSPSLPDAPTYVYCQQADGSFKEVSQQLFGQQLSVNGGYPLVADFNGDGIDDIFLKQSWDGYFTNDYFVYTLISQSNGTYKVNKIDAHASSGLYGLTAIDINQDGCLDVVVSFNDAWQGDCAGNFALTKNAFNWSQVGTQYYGEAITSADFLGKGYKQILMTSSNKTTPNYPNAVIDIDKNLNVIGAYPLPIPYFTATLGAGSEDDAAVRVIDINNDGKPDVIINSTNFFYASSLSFNVPVLTKMLIYLNNGNGTFTDISNSALPGFDSTLGGGFFNMRVLDLNGDGYQDLAFDGQSFGTGKDGNQVWINNKNNTFTPVFTSELDALSNSFSSQFGAVGPNNVGIMLPIKVGNAWNYLIHVRDSKGQYHDGIVNTQYVFK